MSGLPEWLWPVEDEQAVQEAERLIEETHNKLRRMEAEMRSQRTTKQSFSEKSEKLKTDFSSKMQSLEEELNTLFESRNKVLSNRDLKDNKPNSTVIPHGVDKKQPTNRRKILPKAHASFSGQQQSVALPLSQKTSKSKTSVNTAEKVVLTARAKVQDALAVARNVSASLGQHVRVTSVHTKPQSSCQATNVGVYEIKSQVIEKPLKPRLEQALLPSISIKCELERQSIPPIHVPPGERVVPTNVSVISVQHAGKEQPSSKEVQAKVTSNPAHGNPCENTQYNTEIEVAVAQISKQLADIEELREINQAQVNHVLRFLLTRVCTTTESPPRSEKPTANKEAAATHDCGTKEDSPASASSSSSENSQNPIAYDSLSRFLETYRKAAEQNMVVKKRAAIRRQRVTIKQKTEIEQVKNPAGNHLLIGPLRRSIRVAELDQTLPEVHVRIPIQPQGALSHLHQSDHQNNSNSGIAEDRHEDLSILHEKEELHLSMNQVLHPMKPFLEISGDEYEDDWEEEDNVLQQNEEGHFSLPSLQSNVGVEKPSPEPSPLKSPNVEKTDFYSISINHSTAKVNLQQEGENLHEQSLVLKNMSAAVQDNYNTEVVKTKVAEVAGNKETQQNVYDQEDNPEHSYQEKSAGDQLVKPVDVSSQKSTTRKETNPKHAQNYMQKKSQRKDLSSSCSSADDEIKYNNRVSSGNAKWWDLKLREDIQLQSAILLNWQLEDRWKNKSSESEFVKEHNTVQTNHKEVIADVEKRWQHSLDRLDQRLKMIEDNDRIHQIVNAIRRQSTPIVETSQATTKEAGCNTNKVPNMDTKNSMRDQMVQTTPQNNRFIILNKESGYLSDQAQPHKSNFFQDFKSTSGQGPLHHQHSIQLNKDLTSELLAYSRMGILAGQGTEKPLSSSSSSSIASSHLVCSGTGISLSDGELRDSASASCSCSEGEFCMCGVRRPCSRAPPDGSQAFSNHENFLKDVSQGEIPPSQIKDIIGDTSHGEIGLLSQDPDLVEEGSCGSDGIEWEPR